MNGAFDNLVFRGFRSIPSRWRVAFVVLLVAGLFSGLALGGGEGPPPPMKEPATDGAWKDHVRRMFQKYCFECHSEKKAKGGLRLDMLDADFRSPKSAAAWKLVAERVSNQNMPPEGKPQLAKDELERLRSWIATGQAAADAAQQRTEGRAMTRRLSRTEYVNTIRDLLVVDVPLQDLLPEDLPAADGFENDGAVLRLSSVLIERYMEAADIALKAALHVGPKPAPTKARFSYKDERSFKLAKMDKKVAELENAVVLLLEKTIGLAQFKAPMAARYRFRVSAYAYQHNGKPMVMAVHTGAHLLGHYTVPADKAAVVEFTVSLEAGQSIHLAPDALKKERGKGALQPGLAVEWVEVEGPLFETWPPESYQRLLGKVDLKTATLADAEQVLRPFVARAFRRPVTEDLLRPYREIVRQRLAKGQRFEEALEVALKAVLCSSHFLFLEGPPGRLDDFALASRLSYFLWSTMPDAELFERAGKGDLHTPAVLRAQVERLLRDPKAAAFCESFLDQWLELRLIDANVPDKTLYPEFGELLRASMLQETRLFFGEILANDLTVLNIVDSDFAMLNEPLAQLYGIPGVEGTDFRKVPLPEGSHRGGVLTQASILKVTANGLVTSPVTRGVWVMKNILGQPVPAPPADVPAIEPDTRGAVTIRAQLAKHRQVEACATCHRKIDPLGFALESYDVMGRWREKYRVAGVGKKGEKVDVRVGGRLVQYHMGPKVEPGDVLPDGRPYKDIEEFKKLLRADPDTIARCVTQKLVIYATGNDIRPADHAAIDALVGRVRDKNYGLRALVHEVVQSDLFLKK